MMNFGFGYPGMLGMYGTGMPMNGMNTPNYNVDAYFHNKYGCENCFKKGPYYVEYPKPIIAESPKALRPSLFRRLLNNIFGG